MSYLQSLSGRFIFLRKTTANTTSVHLPFLFMNNLNSHTSFHATPHWRVTSLNESHTVVYINGPVLIASPGLLRQGKYKKGAGAGNRCMFLVSTVLFSVW